jgi:hypothetical protein
MSYCIGRIAASVLVVAGLVSVEGQQPAASGPDGDLFGLSSLPLLRHAETRSISAENPTGEKGGGAKAMPGAGSAASELGPGWKVRPAIDLPGHQTVTITAIKGPGVIKHIWVTVNPKAYRDWVLRFYWDDETSPSVEVPLGDFFAEGHGERYNVNSLMVAVNPSGGFNSYWPMPFRRSAKITIENQSRKLSAAFFIRSATLWKMFLPPRLTSTQSGDGV